MCRVLENKYSGDTDTDIGIVLRSLMHSLKTQERLSLWDASIRKE